MAEKIINDGKNLGEEILYSKNGYIETVTDSNTYRLKKAVDVDVNIEPDYELIYDDDQGSDPIPNGEIGTWDIEMPLTSDVISKKDLDTVTLTITDKQTVSYWMYELGHKRFPQITFRETITDNKENNSKKHTLNFIGTLTKCQTKREDGAAPRKLVLGGLIKKYIDFTKES
ncbi:MAG: hypothetical protein HRU07_06655 [Nitrosopumilus sp.]|nr:hypothetical protein [Nitrosopumilus sp.]NRA05821.1 hypothetical protein [Nitrosopumilus sp.]